MGRPSTHAQEVRKRAIRIVPQHAAQDPSQWAAIRSIAERVGCTHEALRRWVRTAERDKAQRKGLTTDERQSSRVLQRDNAEPKRASDILRKASAYFVHAELDRRGQ